MPSLVASPKREGGGFFISFLCEIRRRRSADQKGAFVLYSSVRANSISTVFLFAFCSLWDEEGGQAKHTWRRVLPQIFFFGGGGPLCSTVGKEERERIGEMSQMCQQRRGREEKDGDFFEARSELGVPPRLMWPQKKKTKKDGFERTFTFPPLSCMGILNFL